MFSAMPMPASPAPRNSTRWSLILPPVMRSADKHARERHGAGALDVVVERAGAVAVFFQQAEGVAVAEILKLHEHAGENFFPTAAMNSSMSAS
jgi:hypothetical protein